MGKIGYFDKVVRDLLQHATYGLSALKTLLDAIKTDRLENTTYGLSALKTLLDAIQTSLQYQFQTPAELNQASPVQNQWYTVLDTTNALLLQMAVMIYTTSETLEIKITLDGEVSTTSLAATNDTVYGFAYRVHPEVTQPVFQAGLDYTQFVLIPTRIFKVEVRKTTANGTGRLRSRVVYAKR